MWYAARLIGALTVSVLQLDRDGFAGPNVWSKKSAVAE
jgi:hypothetical protein